MAALDATLARLALSTEEDDEVVEALSLLSTPTPTRVASKILITRP